MSEKLAFLVIGFIILGLQPLLVLEQSNFIVNEGQVAISASSDRNTVCMDLLQFPPDLG